MNDDITNRSPPGGRTSGQASGDGSQTLTGREILLILGALALACVGGYFFVLKMIDVSQVYNHIGR